MRYIEGLGGLSTQLEVWMVGLPLMEFVSAEESGVAVKDIVDKIYGDTSKLDSLSESTQDDREALGYAANEPLLRTGELLKDSVRIEHPTPDTVSIVSDEPIHMYHEYGYYNVRANTFVPPRPVFRIAAAESYPVIEAIAGRNIEDLFGSVGKYTPKG
jgi:hypothetical protein